MDVLIGVGQIVLGIILGYFITKHFFDLQQKVDKKKESKFYNNELINEVVELGNSLIRSMNDFQQFQDTLERQRNLHTYLSIKGHLLSDDMNELIKKYNQDVNRLIVGMLVYIKNSTNREFMQQEAGNKSLKTYTDSVDEITNGLLETHRQKIVKQIEKEFK